MTEQLPTLDHLQHHSPLGPSGAERWLNCPGSVNATKHLADTHSDYAAEGIFAHYISELARIEKKDANHYLGRKCEDDKFECDTEMVNAVQYFLDYINQFEAEEQLIEQRVNYNAWVDDGFGTLDAGLLNDGTCLIIDLKYGKGIQVWAEDNPQLKLYALGVFQEYGHLYDIQKFKLCICQPRIDHVDEWTISIEELLVWAEETVEPTADKALTDDAPFQAGEWCRWGKIKSTCKTRAETVKAALLDEIQDIRDPNEMGNDELGECASLVPTMQSWCKDIMALVEKKVVKGEKIVGEDGLPFKMVEGRSNRCWIDEAKAERALRNYKYKVSEIFTRKLITAPQAEKLVGKDHAIMKNHVHKPQGKPVLVPGSDKREPFKISTDELEDLDE
jgi:hypothetical protein